MHTVEVNNQHPSLQYTENEVDALFQFLATLDFCSVNPGELSIVFMTDSALAKLHADFMDDPSPTDVITFPGDPDHQFAGEICVSVDRAQQMGASLGIGFPKELTLYLVHGWLHLAGYDDIDPKDRESMREAERKALEAIQKADIFPSFKLC